MFEYFVFSFAYMVLNTHHAYIPTQSAQSQQQSQPEIPVDKSSSPNSLFRLSSVFHKPAASHSTPVDLKPKDYYSYTYESLLDSYMLYFLPSGLSRQTTVPFKGADRLDLGVRNRLTPKKLDEKMNQSAVPAQYTNSGAVALQCDIVSDKCVAPFALAHLSTTGLLISFLGTSKYRLSFNFAIRNFFWTRLPSFGSALPTRRRGACYL